MTMNDAQRAAWDAQHPIDHAARETADQLASTDAGMARATEDLIALLIAKQVIGATDLPAEASDRIAHRHAVRTGTWTPPSRRKKDPP